MLREFKAKRIRNWIMYPYFITYFIVATGRELNFSLGLPLIIAGFILRFFASGFISKSKELCTSGPYAFIRHPLYAGSFLIGLGLSSVSNNFYLVCIYIVLFILFHERTIANEDKYLENKFGAKFLDYKKYVPALFPNFISYNNNPKKNFSLKLVVTNGEIIRIIGISLLVFFLFFIEEFSYRKAGFEVRQFILFWWFIFLFGFLFVNLNIRKRILLNNNLNNHSAKNLP